MTVIVPGVCWEDPFLGVAMQFVQCSIPVSALRGGKSFRAAAPQVGLYEQQVFLDALIVCSKSCGREQLGCKRLLLPLDIHLYHMLHEGAFAPWGEALAMNRNDGCDENK